MSVSDEVFQRARAVGQLTLARSAPFGERCYEPVHNWEDSFREELINFLDWLSDTQMPEVTNPLYEQIDEGTKPTEAFYSLLFRSKCQMRQHKVLVEDIFNRWLKSEE